MRIHLHNSTAPAFLITCDICHREIETGPGWLCEVCPDYDICNVCYRQKDGSGGIDHRPKLTNHPSATAHRHHVPYGFKSNLWKMQDLVVHASQCHTAAHGDPIPLLRRRYYVRCRYPDCGKMKVLFDHGAQCPTRASGGCGLCKRMWYLIQLHSQACKQPQCSVPRCSEVKEHLRLQQQQQRQV
ncbi:hypothetical protein L6164_001941 [Bauhinia variegata]|uniref:Uncharacterized protein n=1 Tax=Bauhinia variegata TaxID=167791 RepID=A0ACB9QB73_BAUVA|nr:hypothetical protein L6164_001941 [Bauhinia variegata]